MFTVQKNPGASPAWLEKAVIQIGILSPETQSNEMRLMIDELRECEYE